MAEDKFSSGGPVVSRRWFMFGAGSLLVTGATERVGLVPPASATVSEVAKLAAKGDAIRKAIGPAVSRYYPPGSEELRAQAVSVLRDGCFPQISFTTRRAEFETQAGSEGKTSWYLTPDALADDAIEAIIKGTWFEDLQTAIRNKLKLKPGTWNTVAHMQLQNQFGSQVPSLWILARTLTAMPQEHAVTIADLANPRILDLAYREYVTAERMPKVKESHEALIEPLTKIAGGNKDMTIRELTGRVLQALERLTVEMLDYRDAHQELASPKWDHWEERYLYDALPPSPVRDRLAERCMELEIKMAQQEKSQEVAPQFRKLNELTAQLASQRLKNNGVTGRLNDMVRELTRLQAKVEAADPARIEALMKAVETTCGNIVQALTQQDGLLGKTPMEQEEAERLVMRMQADAAQEGVKQLAAPGAASREVEVRLLEPWVFDPKEKSGAKRG